MPTQTPEKRKLFASTLKRLSLGVLVGVLGLVVLLGVNPQKTAAATSDTINFQAKLMTSAGAIAADGNYNVEFKLYTVSSGGSALWTEDYLNSNTQAVRVVNGYLTVNLGSITPFPGTINWDQNLWIGMTVRGTGSCSFGSCSPTDAEMTPRLKLTATPFALSAGNLANVSAGGFRSTLTFQGATGGNQTFQIPDLTAAGSDTVCLQTLANCTGTGGGIAGSGTQHYLSVFDTVGGNHIAGLSSGNATVYDDGSFFGIGTTTNNALLSVQGASTSQSSIFVQAASSASAPTIVVKQAGSQTGDLFQFQDSGGNINGAVNSTGNQLSLGKVTAGSGASQGKIVLGDGTNDNFAVIIQTATQTTGSATLSFPNLNGVNSTVALTNDTTNFIRNQSSQQASSNFNISNTGIAGVSFLTPLLDTPSGTTTLNIGTTNATAGINLNQSTTLLGGKNLVFGSGAGNFDQHNSTGTFQTGSGAVSLNGDITIAANKGLTFASGSGSFDQSASSGAFKTGTGAVTLNGDTTINGSKTLTVGTGLTTLGGGLAVTSGSSDFTNSIATKKGTDFSTTGTSNNVSFSNASLIRLTGASAQTITGIANGRDGYILTLANAGSNAATLKNNDTTDSSAANVIITGTGLDFTLQPGGSISLVYDSGASLWRVNGGAGGVTTVGAVSGTPTANGATITGSTLNLAVADGSNAGLISTAAQTIGGAKTFSALITGNAGLNVSGGAITLQGNAASSITTTSGDLTLDAAAGLKLGNTNATSVTIGRATVTTTIQGNTAVTLSGTTGTALVCQNGSSLLSTCDPLFINPTAANFIKNGAASQSGQFNITLSGTAQTSFLTPLLDTPSGTTTLNIGTTNATSGINLNQNVSIAAGKSITFASGAGGFDQSASTGTFKTGTGAVSLNGDTTLAAGKGLAFASGAGTFDQSASTGFFKTGTGAVTLNGATTANAGLTVTSGGNVAFQKTTDYSTTGSANDVSFGTGALVRLTGASAQTITGISGGVDGRILTIVNAASNAATLSNNNAASLAANRITTGTNSDVSLPAGATITLVYDSGDSLWRVTGSTAATGGVGINTVGAVSSTPTANGATITGTTLNLAVADGTNAGLLSTVAQTIGGAKTFSALITGNAGLNVSGGAVTLQGNTNSSLTTSSGTLNIDGPTLTMGTSTATSISLGNVNASTTTTINGGTGASALSLQAGSGGTISVGTVNNNIIAIGTAAVAGTITVGGTSTTGTLILGQSTDTNTINIGNGVSANTKTETVNIANSGAAGSTSAVNIGGGSGTASLTLGNTGASSTTIIRGGTGASAISIQAAGAGGISIGTNTNNTLAIGTAAVAGTITIGGTSTTGTMILGQSTDTNIINLGNGVTASAKTQTINIGNSGASGSTTAINLGGGSGTSTLAFGNTGASSTTTINGGTGASALSLQAGSGGTISVGTSNNNIIAIGTASVAGTITLGGTSQTGTTILGQSTDTNIINLGNGATANTKTQTVNIANSAVSGGTDAVNIGNSAAGTSTLTFGNTVAGSTTTISGGTGSSAVAIQAGAGGTINVGTANNNNVSINIAAVAGTTTIGGTGTTGTITLGQSTATNTINIGANIGASATQTINIGNSATASSTTNLVIGSTIAGTTTLQSAGGTTINSNVSISSGKTVTYNGSAGIAFAASSTGGFDQSASSGTFKTGSGAVSLNGDTTVASGKLLTAASINTTAAATTTLGNSTGAFTIQGSSTSVLKATSGANTTTIDFTTPTANVTLHVPALATGTYNICTDSGNCAGVGATLQTSYNFSAGGTTPEIKLDTTRGAVDIQDADTSIGATANLFAVRGTNGGGGGFGAQYFNIQGNGNVGIGVSGNPSALLSVGGATGAFTVNSSGNIVSSGTLTINNTSALNGAVTISGSSDVVQAKIKANSSQTNDLVQFTASNGTTIYSGIDNLGNFYEKDQGSGFTGTIKIPSSNFLASNVILTFPDATHGGEICTVSGNCSGVGGTGNVLNGGQAAGVLVVGTQTGNTNTAAIDTNGINRVTFDTSSNAFFGNGVTAASPTATFTIQGTGSTTAATAGTNLTVAGGLGASTGAGSTGGVLNLQGGAAGGSGNNNGGNVTIAGGAGVNSGVQGTVSVQGSSIGLTGTTNINTSGAAATNIGGGSAGAITLQSSGAINSTAGANSIISTTSSHTLAVVSQNFNLSAAGVITLAGSQSGGDITTATAATATNIGIQPGISSAASGTGASLNLTAGNQSGTTTAVGGTVNITGGSATGASGTRTGGGVVLDAGTGSSSANNGTVAIGTTNASAISEGRTGITTTNNGALTITQLLTGNGGATIGGGAIALTGNAASSFTTSSGALTLTSAAAATWGTSAGDLTVQANGASNLNLTTSGAGTVNVATTGATALLLGNTSASFTAESNATANLFNGATAHTVQLATGAAVQGVTIGSTNSTSSLTLQAGTGNINIGNDNVAKTTTINIGADSTGADIVAVGSTNASSTLTLEGGTGASAIQIGNGNTAHGIQIGTGGTSTAQAIVIGSASNTTSTLKLQGGTGTGTPAITLTTGSNAGTAGTISIGNTGAVTQEIDLGINTSGSSTTNVFIGSTQGGVTTLQSSGGTTINSNTTVSNGKNFTVNSTASTGTFTMNYASPTNNATSTVINATNGASSGTVAVNAVGINLSGTNTSGANTTNALNFANITTPGTGTQTYNGLNFGTGYTNLITSTNFSVSAAGVLQGASATLSAANALTLGLTGTNTGAIVFKGSTGSSGTLTLVGPANPNTGNFTLTIPAIGASATVCTTDSVCALGSGGTNNYLTQVPSSNSANAAGANVISPTASSIVGLTVNATTGGTAATAAIINQTQAAVGLQINNTSSGTSLNITTSVTPTTAVIVANDTSGTATDKLLSLQAGGTPKFTVDAAGNTVALGTLTTGSSGQHQVDASGNITTTGTYNTNTFTKNTLTFGDTTADAAISSGAGRALNLTGNAASTFSTSAGNLTLQAATTNSLILNTAGAGTVAVGDTNSTTINIGRGSDIARSISIGTAGSATNQTVLIGSANNGSTTKLQGGAYSLNVTNTGVGINAGATPSNGFTINTLTTSASGYQQAISTGGTGNNGLVVQGVASQGSTSKYLSIQDSAGANVWQIGADDIVNLGSSTHTPSILFSSTDLSHGGLQKTMTAGTGGVSATDVVVFANDSGNARVIDTTTPNDPRVFGVAMSTATAGNTTNIATYGFAIVKYTTNGGTTPVPSVGDILVTSPVAGSVQVDNFATKGILGYATTAGSGGTVGVVINPVGGAGGTDGNSLVQVPASNTAGASGANVVSPTVNSITGLTINGTTGTAATAEIINQAQNAIGLQINGSGTSNSADLGLSSTSVTNGNIATISQSTSTYTGTALLLNMANGSGSFSGKFVDLQVGGTSKFTVDANGIVTLIGGNGSNGDIKTANASGATNSLNIVTGNSTTAGATGAVTIKSGDATSGASGTVTIDNGSFTSGTPTINIGNTNAKTVQIGNTTNTTTLTLDAAAGSTVNIANSGNTHTVAIATGAAVQGVTVGSTNSTSTLNLQSGTGTGTGDVNIDDNTNAGKIIDIGSVDNAGTTTVHIATNASSAQTVTIGSNNGSSAVTLQSGTNNISLLTNGGGSSTTGTLVQSVSNNSTKAFQVQNASNVAILNADTTINRVTITGGPLVITGIASPTAPTLASVGTTGTLGVGTYLYKLAAISGDGSYSTAVASSPTFVTTSGTTSKNTLTWSAVTNATGGYAIYRSINNGVSWFKNTVAAGTTTLIDNGSTYTWATAANPTLTNYTSGIITASDALTLQQTGDVLGATSLSLQNRGGSAGALFTNSSLGLVDFGFVGTDSGVQTKQGNLRYEARSGSLLYAGNTSGELQWLDDATGSFSMPFVTGKSTTAVRATSTTAFLVQNAGGATTLLTADASASRRVTIGTVATPLGSTSSNGDLVVNGNAEVQGNIYIGSAAGNIQNSGSGGSLRYSGTARNTKTIALTPEFAGMSLTGSGIGTLTSGVDTTAGAFKNYYNWTTTQSSAQTYDMYIRVPVPRDFGAFTTGDQICYNTWSDDASQVAVNTIFYDTGSSAQSTFDAKPGSTSAWVQKCTTNIGGTATVNGNTYWTVRITLNVNQNKNLRIGDITFDYLSTY